MATEEKAIKQPKLSNLEMNDLLLLKHEVDAAIRHRRIKGVLANIAAKRSVTAVSNVAGHRMYFLEEALGRELRQSVYRQVIIDDIVEQLELLLRLD